MLFTPLVLKDIQNDQIVKGDISSDHEPNKKLIRQVSLDIRMIRGKESNNIQDGILDGDEEVNMIFLSEFNKKKKDIEGIFSLAS